MHCGTEERGRPDPSRLVLGLGTIHHLMSPWSRARLLEEAIARGIRAFDAAPAYGNGLAEVELGKVTRGLRASVEINTKVGIPIRIYPAWARFGFPAFRALDMVTAGHRQRYRRRDFRARTIVESLDRSLLRLRTDYVDNLFLHEPLQPFVPAEVEEIDECVAQLLRQGKIRAFGIAGPVRYWAGPAGVGPASVIQCPMSDLQLPEVVAAATGSPFILYGTHRAFAEAHARIPGSYSTFLAERMAALPRARFIVGTNTVANLKNLTD